MGELRKKLRERIQWSALQDAGFDRFGERAAWRHASQRIDVVSFQFFTPRLARAAGCTLSSFSVNLGCWFTWLPRNLNAKDIAEQDGALVPEEYECPIRRRLKKRLRQPELRRDDIWYVGAKGEQLRECVADALSTIQSDGLRWFDRFAKDREIIRTLERDREAETYGFGAQNSPQRHRLVAYAELSQNNRKAAYQHFNAALEQLRRTAKSSGPHPFEAELLQVIAALKD